MTQTFDLPTNSSQPAEPAPRRKKWRWLLRAFAVVLALVVLRAGWIGVLLLLGGKPPTVSRETTYVLGPVRADGTVDYLAALNARAAEGVTPENNAAVPLMQVLGYVDCDQLAPSIPNQKNRETACDRLLAAVGVEPLPRQQRLTPLDWDSDLMPVAVKGELIYAACRAPWDHAKFPHSADALRANDAALDRVVVASRRSRYYIRRYEAGDDETLMALMLPDLHATREAARQLAARAMFRIAAGQSNAAAEDLLACHRLGRLVSQGPMIVSWLVGTIVDGIGDAGDAALAHYGGLSRQQLADYRRRLRQLPPMRPLTDAMVDERLMALDVATALAVRRYNMSGGKQRESVLMRLLDANKILPTVNAIYDDADQAFALPTYAERKVAADQAFHRLTDAIQQRGSPLRWLRRMTVDGRDEASYDMGERLANLFLPATGACLAHEEQWHRRRVMTDLGLALAEYRSEHGEYPESLAALKPDPHAAVAQDGSADFPLEYHRTASGYVLRSRLAQSLSPPNSDDDEIVIEMPVPVPEKPKP